MSEIGSKRWGEVYKRVLVLQRESVNLGLVSDPLPIESGDGVGSPLLMGSNIVGISGNKKFFFGDQNLYLRKLRANVIEVGVPDRVVVRALSAALFLSAIQLKTEEVFAGTIDVGEIIATGIARANKFVAPSLAVSNAVIDKNLIAQTISAIAGTFADLWVEQLHTPSVDMTHLEVGELDACKGTFNTRVASPSVSAVSLQGCSNMMAWW